MVKSPSNKPRLWCSTAQPAANEAAARMWSLLAELVSTAARPSSEQGSGQKKRPNPTCQQIPVSDSKSWNPHSLLFGFVRLMSGWACLAQTDGTQSGATAPAHVQHFDSITRQLASQGEPREAKWGEAKTFQGCNGQVARIISEYTAHIAFRGVEWTRGRPRRKCRPAQSSSCHLGLPRSTEGDFLLLFHLDNMI